MKFIEKLFLHDLRLTGKIVLSTFLGLALIIFLAQGVIALIFEYPLDYGEGQLLNQAFRITQGEPLYPADITTPPYLISNYPPVYILINAFFIWIFGPSLLIGRLIAFLSTLGSAFLIASILREFMPNRKFLPLVTGSVTFLINPYVLEWSSLFRIDMLALLFSLAGLYCVIKNPQKNKSIILASILFVLAAYTRQSYGLAAPLAALIWTWTKNKKQALKLFLIYAISGLAIFGLLQTLTNRGFFFHIITANINPFNWTTVLHFAQDVARKMPWVLALLVFYLALGWRYTQSYPYLAPYLIAGMIAALTIGKVGSNVNYLVEISAGFGLLTGIIYGELCETIPINSENTPEIDFKLKQIPKPESMKPLERKNLWINLTIFLVLTGVLLFQIASLTQDSLFGPIPGRRDRIKRGNDYIYLKEKIKNASKEGPVLADEFMAMLPDNRIQLYFAPFEMTQLSNTGIWDQTRFLKSIEDQNFPVILIHHFQNYPVYLERWTNKMQQAIFDNYVPVEMKADSIIFEPKDFENKTYPDQLNCPNSLWQLPTSADMGLLWHNGQLLMMGSGRSGENPVYAVADGLLYQFPEWEAAVSIQHEDPLNPSEIIWSFYGDMAPAFDIDNHYIETKFIGAEGVLVKAGDLIGYQGSWMGACEQTWVHLRFTLLPAGEDGGFPEPLLAIDDFYADLPAYKEQIRLGLDTSISLSAYTGLPESDIFGTLDFLPFECAVGGE